MKIEKIQNTKPRDGLVRLDDTRVDDVVDRGVEGGLVLIFFLGLNIYILELTSRR